MTDTNPSKITNAYDIAAAWMPENREGLLGNVVKTIFADSESNGGFAAIHNFGKERLVKFDVITGTVAEAMNSAQPATSHDFRTSSSPTGTHRLDLRDCNLWLVDLQTGVETQITDDGTADYPYAQGRQARPYDERMKHPLFLWSPDGRYAVTQRLDVRGVNVLSITESAPRDGGLPKTHTTIDGFPGNEFVPHIELLIIDTETGAVTPVDLHPVAATHTSPLMRKDVWWSPSSSRFYLVRSSRDWLNLDLIEIRADTGETIVLVQEESNKRIRPNLMFHQPPCIAVNDAGGTPTEAIWFSERDGWGHLYLYDTQSSETVRQLTCGEFVVSSIHRVDWHQRQIWISVAGKITEDPYREAICMVDIDTCDLTIVTNDNFDHRVVYVPESAENHPWFVEAVSTVSDPATYIVRSWDGDTLVDLGTVDTSRLEATGWRAPERFRAKAADGETDVFGTIFFPPNFDPGTTYPVIDHVYPGPQMHRSVPYFSTEDIEPYAALGLVGITVDGKGTPMRNRKFYDASWNNVGGGSGLEDHVSAIQELAQSCPWIDVSNVGIHGRSAGGFATARAMELYPEFFKVGVAAAGRFEGRLVMAMIMEAYDDPYDHDSWQRASAVEAGGDITGKFLIVHGEMDMDCTIFHAYRLIDKMIDENRDFDLLVIPGDDHVFSRRKHYVERRIWDYLTTHLLRAKPPVGYRL